jgi:outer membrane murein-binding lipoprotein Lpp
MTPRKLKSPGVRLAQFVACVTVLCWTGCQNAAVRRADELEARLRDQQSSIDRLSASLERVESDRDVARREASILRDELVKLEPSPAIVQTAHSTARIDRIEVAPLLSGGLDRDDVPGDEKISLLIAPKDSTGEIHRVPGQLSVRLTDIARPAGMEEVAAASFTEVEAASLWHNGIVGRGYRIIMPLPVNFTSRSITAHVRFVTNVGTQLDTLQQMSVTPQTRNLPATIRD